MLDLNGRIGRCDQGECICPQPIGLWIDEITQLLAQPFNGVLKRPALQIVFAGLVEKPFQGLSKGQRLPVELGL